MTLQSICPSCGKTDKSLWPEGCNNQWHKEEWARLQQENAKLREALEAVKRFTHCGEEADWEPVEELVTRALLEAQ